MPADDVAELRWFARDELPRDDELAFATVKDALAAWRDAGGGSVDPASARAGLRRLSEGECGGEIWCRYTARPSERSIAPLGCAPMTAAEGSPPLNRIIVGIDAIP